MRLQGRILLTLELILLKVTEYRPFFISVIFVHLIIYSQLEAHETKEVLTTQKRTSPKILL